MSPLDDELRTAFRARAGHLAPSPDPLAGIERRARSIRRRRVASSVAGTALAVSVLAVGVPAVVDGPSQDRSLITATQPPAPSPPAGPYALDPADPWPYRGDPSALADGTLETLTRDFETRHGAGTFTPLYGERDEQSGEVTVVWVGTVGDVTFWGVVRSAEGGPDWLVDRPLPAGTLALPFALGADVARLVVVSAPEVGLIQYSARGAAPWTDMEPIAPGVAVTPLDGDRAADAYRVLDEAGTTVERGPAPEPTDEPASEVEPANLLDWPARGTIPQQLEQDALSAFGAARGRPGEPVRGRVLFGGQDDAGNAFVLMQAWLEGDDAFTFGYSTGPGRAPQATLKGKTEPDAPVLALLVPASPGQSTDTLVVVPRPGTGQVLYAEAGGTPRPVGVGQDSLDGVVLVDRAPGARGDRLQLLDGNGGEPSFDGAVVDLLCRLDGCD